jgi:murein DD-endopeptidase MepM/ murein hydrolase activator NlpD
MPIARPMRALVVAVTSLILSSVLIFGVSPAVLALPSDPEPGEAAASVQAQSGALLAPPQRGEIITYRIKSGDTLWDIAAAHDIDVDTIRWSNPTVARNPDSVALGTELIILPIKGAYITAEPGDTVARLAERWGVSPEDIVNYPPNDLSAGEEPRSGAKLIIPYGRLEVNLAPPGPPPAGFDYAWPIRGTVTQGYGSGHPAADFGAPYGAKVYATRPGRVVLRQWSPDGYGFLVIVDHGDGSRAYYSHLKGAWADVGDWLPRGGLVGEVGSTGNSTGPHVHFEIRIGGVPQNPLGLLPPKA